MLIDDSDIDLFIQRRFLEVHRFASELLLMKSAVEALTVLESASRSEAPDIIFLDLNMPEFDGFAFLRRFQQLPEAVISKTKIVVVTSSNSIKDRDHAFTFANVIQFVTKPLKQNDIDELRQLL